MYYDFDMFEIDGNILVKYIGGDQEIVEVPEGIEIIGEEAFSCLSVDVQDVVLPSTIKHIRRSAFDASGIYGINFPEGLISIGDYAFNETNLFDITLPSTLARIGQSVFSSTDLKYVEISPDNPFYALRGDSIFDLTERKIIAGFGNLLLEGDDIECIADNAFRGMSSLYTVTIPEGVKRLGEDCFSFCKSISTINLPSTLISIGKGAFSCSSIRSVVIPGNVEIIDEKAFYNCTSLENVEIANGVKRIESAAFHSCTKIQSIKIPASVMVVGERAFCDNDRLETICCDRESKPIGWHERWNYNAEWKTTLVGRPVSGGINTNVVWNSTNVCDNDDLVYGLDKDYVNHDISISLKSVDFELGDEVYKLNFKIENKTNKQMRVWLSRIAIEAEVDTEEIDEYSLLIELNSWCNTEVTYRLDSSLFGLFLTPACTENNPYNVDMCCSTLSFDMTYDFGGSDIAESCWQVFDYEIDPDGIYVDDYDDDEETFTSNTVLYIYKGNIKCHRFGHDIIQATAVLHNKTDNEIEINVEYCTDCKKFILEYTVFEQYRNRYGALVGNFRMTVNGEFDGEYDLAEESPLMLSGYNVSQRDGYTSRERHYILARIIHDGIMEKGDVIRYLSYFIRKNGAKRGNELALSKWEDDLAFVQEYDKSTQPKTIISDIRRY